MSSISNFVVFLVIYGLFIVVVVGLLFWILVVWKRAKDIKQFKDIFGFSPSEAQRKRFARHRVSTRLRELKNQATEAQRLLAEKRQWAEEWGGAMGEYTEVRMAYELSILEEFLSHKENLYRTAWRLAWLFGYCRIGSNRQFKEGEI